MNRVAILPIALTLSAAHCTSQSAGSVNPQAEKPAPPPVKAIEAPAGFQLFHFGRGAEFKIMVKALYPELFTRWSQGDLIVLKRDELICASLRIGHQIETITPCPKTTDAVAKPETVVLKHTLFSQALQDGWLVLKPGSGAGSAQVPRGWLLALLEPLGLPVVDLPEVLEIRSFGQPEGTGFAFDFVVAEDVLERLGRFDLSKRYGGFADYVRDVRAWGDGATFQWIIRLDGGGAGLRVDGRRLRLAVQAGSAWKEQLDALLRAEQIQPIDLPVLSAPGLSIRVEQGTKLGLRSEQKPLPTRTVLQQLEARLVRWLATAEEEQ